MLRELIELEAMFEITLKELEQVTGGVLHTGSAAGESLLRGVSIDSRTVKKGNLFVAIPGDKFDGHDFVKQASDQGAQAALVARDRWTEALGRSLGNMVTISVLDTKKALGDLAAWYKAKFEIPTVAVTGTNGKTTTKEMVAEALSDRFKVIKSPQSYNNRIGVPLTIFRLNSNSGALVVELGMSQPGEIATLAKMARPHIGVITNIGPAHLESMLSLEQIAKAKFELPDNMPSPKTLILNADDPLLDDRIRQKKPGERIVSFGVDRQADFRADQIKAGADGLVSFRVNRGQTVNLLLLGRHNVYNALAALAVADLMGVEQAQAIKKLERYTPSDLRMELVVIRDVTVINDSYNANPVSMERALETLKEMKASGRRIAVLADMLELGERSAQFHAEVGRKANELGIDLLLTVGELAGRIAQGAKQAGMSEKSVRTFESNQQVSHYLLENLQAGDAVLVKGSRKMKTEEIVAALKSLYGRQN
jgi:UDP-N-acetylmuramoyl-tripeptide--D-alanyl-D-alanine ligase